MCLPIQERECYKGLIALADESQQHIQSLATLDVDVNPKMIVAIIEEKLHKSTSEKWDETVKKGKFPKLEDLTDFLYRTAARISKCKSDNPSIGEHADKGSPSFEKRKIVYNRQAFVTSTTKNCPLCSEVHMLFKCGKFLTLTVNERFKVVKNASLCFNCLRNHTAKDCKFGSCKKCGKRHNTLLHFTKSPDQSTSNVA